MADTDDAYKPAASRNASNKELSEQNAALDAQIEEEVKQEHERRRKEAPKRAVRQVAASASSAMQGFDPLRPVRMLGAFVKGTIMGTLGFAGKGAQYGLWGGAFFGVLGAIALGMSAGPMALFVGLIGFPVVGFGLGALAGAALGGVLGVNREMKRDKQAEDAARASASKQSRPALGKAQRADVADSLEEERRKRTELNFDRSRQQDLENQRDNQTYWQDRIASESNGWGMGRN